MHIMCVHICTHVHACAWCACTCVHMYTHIRTFIHMHECARMCTHVDACACICRDVHTSACTSMHIHAHTCTSMHIYTLLIIFWKNNSVNKFTPKPDLNLKMSLSLKLLNWYLEVLLQFWLKNGSIDDVIMSTHACEVSNWRSGNFHITSNMRRYL